MQRIIQPTKPTKPTKPTSDSAPPKNVLIIAGLDPSGGAGIAADVTACSLAGCHPAPVVTSLTVQDTCNVIRAEAVNVNLLEDQVRAVMGDMTIHAVKLGVLASPEQISCMQKLLDELDAPVVLDPVLVASGGGRLAEQTIDALHALLPRALISTPNHRELASLTEPLVALGAADTDIDNSQRVAKLREIGARHILLTGGDEPSVQVRNSWYRLHDQPKHYRWPRVLGQFHGSGCTLAATLAAYLAQDIALDAAIENAQSQIQAMLHSAYRPGQYQAVPNRLCSRS